MYKFADGNKFKFRKKEKKICKLKFFYINLQKGSLIRLGERG